LGSFCRANFPSTASSAAGLSLLAQPAAFTCSVSRIVLSSAISWYFTGNGSLLLKSSCFSKSRTLGLPKGREPYGRDDFKARD
jgi:hypothetical protein